MTTGKLQTVNPPPSVLAEMSIQNLFLLNFFFFLPGRENQTIRQTDREFQGHIQTNNQWQTLSLYNTQKEVKKRLKKINKTLEILKQTYENPNQHATRLCKSS